METQKAQEARDKQHNTDTHLARISQCIADLLDLKLIRRGESKGRYDTQWGTKTPLGLYLSIKRIITEERIRL